MPVEVFTRAGTNDLPGGWITFPGGTFEPDSSSNIQRLVGEGISYDRAVDRWVPADWNHISPDGRSYVATGDGTVKIVSAATGAAWAPTMPPANGVPWRVIDFTAAGIYLSLVGGESSEPGLWVLNPDSGSVRKLDGTQFWSQVDSRAAWGVVTAAGSTLLRRLDLHTGNITTQLAVPYHTPLVAGDQLLQLVSLDAAGRPLVLLRDWQNPFPWHMAMLEAAGTLSQLRIPVDWTWPAADNGDPFQASRDVHGYLLTGGIWLVGSDSFVGLALLGSDGMVRQLTTGPDIAQIAGGCH